MSDIATPVNLGMIGVHYVEGELTPEAAATVARLGYTAVWIAGTREARLTIVERVLAATETLAVATGVVNVWYAEARAVADTYHRLEAAYPRPTPGGSCSASVRGTGSSGPTSVPRIRRWSTIWTCWTSVPCRSSGGRWPRSARGC
jgi:hypothetical protein